MSVTESRLKTGTLTLTSTGGTVETVTASCQATNVIIKPGADSKSDQSLEVLCGDVVTGSGSTTPADTLSLTSIQDFSNASGVQAFSWAHRGQRVDFLWKPNGADGKTWTGTVTVDKPIEVGGDVNTRLTATVEWPIVTLHPPTGFGAGYGSVKSAAKPGDSFPAEATITASDATNAAKLSGLGYVASPVTAWTTGQSITVGGFAFNWTGTAWAAGAHAFAAQAEEPKGK